MKLKNQELKDKLIGSSLLWRHRPVKNHVIDEIKNGYIYFSRPDQLNDPYDCFPGLIKMKDDPITIKKYIQKHYPGDSRAERRRQAKELAKTDGVHILEEINSNQIQNIGVGSFTINCSNLMMWSHYSDFHQGICMGYNGTLDKDYFNSWPVKYVQKDESFEVMEFDPSDHDQFAKGMSHLVSVKSFLWQMEYEQRIIKVKSGKYKFAPNALEFIVLGSKISTEFQNEVLNAIHENGSYSNLSVYSLRPSSKNVFGMNFTKVTPQTSNN